jgi:hypothetical protein
MCEESAEENVWILESGYNKRSEKYVMSSMLDLRFSWQ